MQEVVGGVDRDEREDVVAVDEAADRHEEIDRAEAEGVAPRRPGVAPERESEQPGEDVYDVVPAVDLEDDQVAALNARTGVEGRVGDEADDADEQQCGAEDERVHLRRGPVRCHGSSVLSWVLASGRRRPAAAIARITTAEAGRNSSGSSRPAAWAMIGEATMRARFPVRRHGQSAVPLPGMLVTRVVCGPRRVAAGDRGTPPAGTRGRRRGARSPCRGPAMRFDGQKVFRAGRLAHAVRGEAGRPYARAAAGRSTSTFQRCRKPLSATVASSTWSGTSSAVSRPRTPAAIAVSSKPERSRAYQPGAATAAKMSSRTASAAASGRTPRLQRATMTAMPR